VYCVLEVGPHKYVLWPDQTKPSIPHHNMCLEQPIVVSIKEEGMSDWNGGLEGQIRRALPRNSHLEGGGRELDHVYRHSST
jgi:hypothetical protein